MGAIMRVPLAGGHGLNGPARDRSALGGQGTRSQGVAGSLLRA